MDRLEPFLRAGIAVYNAGRYHAAHDAWEDYWLDLEAGPDERFLHGLIQFTAAVHHAHEGNPEGATGLAGSAQGYLGDLPAAYRGVNVGAVRAWLARLETAPDLLDREEPLALRHEGAVVGLADLDPPALGVAARVLAEAEGFEAAVIDRAAERAAADPANARILDPLRAFVTGPDRATAFERLRRRVDPDGE